MTVTTRRTHEEVETRLVRGLERTLPGPHLIEHYRTTGPVDFSAAWAIDARLCLLEVEVKTTSKAIRKVPLPPDQSAFRRKVHSLANAVAQSKSPLTERPPVVMYAEFVYRRRRHAREAQTFVHSKSKLARGVLAAAWVEGERP